MREGKGAIAHHGESLRGMIFDCCTSNRLFNTALMVKDCGIELRHRIDLAENPDLDVERLATAVRIDVNEILSRRYDPMTSGHRSFFGLGVKPKSIEKLQRRFSPAAIKAGVLHHPATHELIQLPFSTVGWDMLQLHCGRCGSAAQGWARGHGTARCDQCASWLWRAAPMMVPNIWRDTLQLLSGIVSPIEGEMEVARELLPEAIRLAPRQLLFDLVMGVALIITRTKEPMKRTQALARACEAIMMWPEGLNRLEAQGVDLAGGHRSVPRNYMVLKEASGPNSQVESTAGVGASSEMGADVAEYNPRFAIGTVSTKYATIETTVRKTGYSKEILEFGWDNGTLTQHEGSWGNKRMRAFDLDEVRRKAPYIRTPQAMSICANLLGIPHYGVEQLVASRMLIVERPSEKRDIREVYRRAADKLRDAIFQKCVSSFEKPVPIYEALRYISGRKKPYCRLIAAILDGDIPIARLEGVSSGSLEKMLAIPKEYIPLHGGFHELPAIRHVTRIEYWTQTDSCSILNLAIGRPSPLLILTSYQGGTSFNYSEGRSKSFKVTDLMNMIEQGAVTSDFSRRANISSRACYAQLKRAGVPLLSNGFWERRAGEKALGL